MTEAIELVTPEERNSNAIRTSTGVMPTAIKKNFIYRKVYREIWLNDSNATFIIVGKPGQGKSTVALKMAQDLDPSFSTERICFNINQFLNLIDKGDSNGVLHPGNVIVFDEIVTDQGAESRSAMSKTNKLMTYITATYRAKRLIVIYCLPSLLQLDKNIRDINVTGIMEVIKKDIRKKKNKVKFLWQSYDARSQAVYYAYPRLISPSGKINKITGVWIAMPEKSLDELYKVRKMHYLNENIKRWNLIVQKQEKKDIKAKMPLMERVRKILENKDEYMTNGYYSLLKIQEKENISEHASERIVSELNKLGKTPL